MYVLMFPIATGGDPWPIERFSCLLAWMFLVPLWTTLRHEKPKTIALQGLLFCILSTLGTLYWFYIAMKVYGNMAGWESFLILLAAGLLVGSIRGLDFFITSRFQKMKHFPLFAALIFTLVEWSMLYIPFQGFPWITPAYAILPMHHFVQSADLIGMAGINFLIFYTNFLIIEFKVQKSRGENPRRRSLIAITLILIAFVLYGVQRISDFTIKGSEMKVALLQGNIPQDIKWNAQDRDDIISNYHNLSIEVSKSNPDLIVWPEASYPQTINTSRTQLDIIPKEITHGTFVIGAPTWFKKDGKTHYQNSAFTLSYDGKIQHRYDKVSLVPFGEYVPDFGFLPIKKIVPAVAGDFSRGSMHQEISQVNGRPFGMFICFEVRFPDIARSWVNQGAQFFVNITNDAWFDRSSGPFQHLRFAAMRAIEFRKPLVRSANTGITTWYDATGEQQTSLGLFEHGYVMASIFPNDIKTFYARFPHLIPAILWILTMCIMLVERRRRS